MVKKLTVKKNNKITCNIAFTRYEIVKHVAEKIFGWKLSTDEEDEKWDILWTDSAVPPEKFSKMQPYQKINHFPGMYSISRKNYLAMNLGKLKKKFPNDYNFFPRSWLYPCDLGDLKSFMQSKKNCYLIVKPEASCQGRGIFLTKRLENIDPTGKFVVQEYLTKPYLIDNLKFDLRIYVLVAGCDPLRIFVHYDGLTRFATEEYSKPSLNNFEDMCMHLTNYAVNKNNPNFIHNENPDDDDSGHKRSLQSTYDYLSDQGYDVEKLKKQIDDAIIKTLCSIQPTLAHHYKSCQPDDISNAMCFEVLGFDVILDSKARPYILEVNHTPSFTTDSPLDWKIKKRVIRDALILMNITSRERKAYLKKQKELILKRALSGKLEKDTKEEREIKTQILKTKRDKWEQGHLGGFRKIYPTENSEAYEKYINYANTMYQEWTGGSISKSKKLILEQEKVPRKVQSVKDVKEPKDLKKPIQLKHKEEDSLPSRCSSIPALISPTDTKKMNNNSVFDRLSRPIIKKYKSSRGTVFPPIIYYEDKQPMSIKQLYPTARLINGYIDSRTIYDRSTTLKQMAPKVFQFIFDKNNDGQ